MKLPVIIKFVRISAYSSIPRDVISKNFAFNRMLVITIFYPNQVTVKNVQINSEVFYLELVMTDKVKIEVCYKYVYNVTPVYICVRHYCTIFIYCNHKIFKSNNSLLSEMHCSS